MEGGVCLTDAYEALRISFPSSAELLSDARMKRLGVKVADEFLSSRTVFLR